MKIEEFKTLEIWAVVLAAGESKRMGSPKMLLPFKGKTVIETVVEKISDSQIENIHVVLGAGKDEIIKLIEKLPVKYCFNENYQQGMHSSVICGIKSIPDDFKAMMVFLGDQPMITADTINQVLSAYKKTGKGLVMPVFKGKRGHPLLIDRKYTYDIENLISEGGLRNLATKFPEEVYEVNVNASEILRDIDTKEDYLNEIKLNE
jgi:molybdenum cofactor cytidylyltransferase